MEAFMKIELKNIGIIKHSDIKLDGLTVITGHNNSGKTTVGKVIYSLVDSVSDLKLKATNDKILYIRKKLDEVAGDLEVFQLVQYIDNIAYDSSKTNNIVISTINREFKTLPVEEIEIFARSLYEFLSMDFSFESGRKSGRKNLLGKINKSYVKILNDKRVKSLEKLEKMFGDLNKDPQLIDYARESINQTLNIEFENQIQPVKGAVDFSEIIIKDENSLYFKIKIQNNNVQKEKKPCFISSPYKKAYFIDDPFIFDNEKFNHGSSGRNYWNKTECETFLNSFRIKTHSKKLKNVLCSINDETVFEKNVINSGLEIIKKQIDEILPGEFQFTSGGGFYVRDGAKLRISNLATGSKMFSILKLLLQKGKLNEETVVILDEPEAHLHPGWQNKFAEIIVLLVKELKIKVVLTTHSPNFMLAIDAYMRKYDIANMTNFYQTKMLENEFAEYVCVNDDLGKIYADFVEYLSDVKALRNLYYCHSKGENLE